MKYTVLLCLLCAAVSGAECQKARGHAGPGERGEAYLLRNQTNRYKVNFRYTCATPSQVERVLVGLPGPLYGAGFSSKSFMNLTLNGIDSRLLEPKKYECFKEGKTSGIDVYYNFDGIPMILRFTVSDDSPLLEMSWRRGKGGLPTPIREMLIRFSVMPCTSGQAKDSYRREIVSPVGIYLPKAKIRFDKKKLTDRDSWLILQDSKYQSGERSQYSSPVFLRPDWKNLCSGEAHYGVHQDMGLEFQLDPKAAEWTFCLLVSERKNSNADFLKFLKKQQIVK